MSTTWIRRITPPRDAAQTALICFPHAGAAATYYSRIARCVALHVEPFGVQYPGRQDRRNESFPESVQRLVDDMIPELADLVESHPFALYGHSLGAVVAFEAARRLHDLGIKPKALFVSGRRSPSSIRAEYSHEYSESDFVNELSRVADGRPAWLDDAELRALLLPVLRADYRMVETYRYADGPPLQCPIVVLNGGDDPYVSGEEAHGWRDFTCDRFEMHTYAGGHFFLETHESAIGCLISGTLAEFPDGVVG